MIVVLTLEKEDAAQLVREIDAYLARHNRFTRLANALEVVRLQLVDETAQERIRRLYIKRKV